MKPMLTSFRLLVFPALKTWKTVVVALERRVPLSPNKSHLNSKSFTVSDEVFAI